MKLTADCSKSGALRAEVLETPSKLPSAVKASSHRPWGRPQRRNEPRAAMCLVPTACHAGGGRGLSVPPGAVVRGLAPSWGAFDFSSGCPCAPHIVSHPSLSSTSSTSSPHSQWTAWLSMSLTNRRELPRAPHTRPCTRHAPRLPPVTVTITVGEPAMLLPKAATSRVKDATYTTIPDLSLASTFLSDWMASDSLATNCKSPRP